MTIYLPTLILCWKTKINTFSFPSRAFPSMFRRHAICGKKRIHLASRTHTKPAKAFKPYDLNVYLLDKNSETTPSPSHELKLVQAGLGKRTISITMDMTHSEVR